MVALSEITNWRRREDGMSLSGQPSEAQMAEIAALGVRYVINLGPHDNAGALVDEQATVTGLGMTYIYIPVDFENPTDADFEAFCAALAKVAGEQVHVHCIYNARVSAFFYRYALAGLGGSVEASFDLMDSIWRPGGVWAAFIGDEESMALPNRYLGYDY